MEPDRTKLYRKMLDSNQSRQTKQEKKVLPMSFYINDRLELARQVFSTLKPKTIMSCAPDFLKELGAKKIEERCVDELLGISKKRLSAAINASQCPLNTDSSDDSDNSDIVDCISLEDISSDGSGESSKTKTKSERENKDLELIELQEQAKQLRYQLSVIEVDSDECSNSNGNNSNQSDSDRECLTANDSVKKRKVEPHSSKRRKVEKKSSRSKRKSSSSCFKENSLKTAKSSCAASESRSGKTNNNNDIIPIILLDSDSSDSKHNQLTEATTVLNNKIEMETSSITDVTIISSQQVMSKNEPGEEDTTKTTTFNENSEAQPKQVPILNQENDEKIEKSDLGKVEEAGSFKSEESVTTIISDSEDIADKFTLNKEKEKNVILKQIDENNEINNIPLQENKLDNGMRESQDSIIDAIPINDDKNTQDEQVIKPKTQVTWKDRWLNSSKVSNMLTVSRISNRVRIQMKETNKMKLAEKEKIKAEQTQLKMNPPVSIILDYVEGSVEQYKAIIAQSKK